MHPRQRGAVEQRLAMARQVEAQRARAEAAQKAWIHASAFVPVTTLVRVGSRFERVARVPFPLK